MTFGRKVLASIRFQSYTNGDSSRKSLISGPWMKQASSLIKYLATFSAKLFGEKSGPALPFFFLKMHTKFMYYLCKIGIIMIKKRQRFLLALKN